MQASRRAEALGAASDDQGRASRCPRCGGAFACGAGQPGPCACSTLTLSPALQTRLRQAYSGCLCLACLRELADSEPEARP